MRALILALLCMATAPFAEAARIKSEGTVEELGIQYVRLRLEGPIEAGDAARLKAVYEAEREAIEAVGRVEIALNSPGGSYKEGLLLAAALRRLGVATTVGQRDVCFSACALAFLGGSEPLRDVAPPIDRLPNQPPARSLARGGVLGFHAPYLEVPNSIYSATTVQTAYRSAVDGISLLVALSDQLSSTSTQRNFRACWSLIGIQPL